MIEFGSKDMNVAKLGYFCDVDILPARSQPVVSCGTTMLTLAFCFHRQKGLY